MLWRLQAPNLQRYSPDAIVAAPHADGWIDEGGRHVAQTLPILTPPPAVDAIHQCSMKAITGVFPMTVLAPQVAHASPLFCTAMLQAT